MDQPDKAIADLNQAIKLSKKPQAELYQRRGEAFAAANQYDNAICDLTRAGAMEPDDTDTLSALAAAYYGRKQYAQEVAALTRLLAIDSDNVDALISRGAAYSLLGRYQEAWYDFRAAAKYDPENAEALNDRAWFLSTNPDPSLRDGRKALDLADRACELTDWVEADYIDTLAAAYAEIGNFDEAAIWEQRALDMDRGRSPANTKVFQHRIDLYRRHLPCREAAPGQNKGT